ncbi:MAG: ABC transporter ATP-binding protein [Humibacillus sp.]
MEGLRKIFGRTVALDGLDLEVAAGEIHGFLGPNWAGKSTTLRLLLGLLRADGGTASVLGGDPWRDVETLHRRLAYVPGDVALWPTLTGGEVIDLLGGLRGGLDPRRRDDMVARFELDLTKKGRSYSKGNRQKVALVAALAADVELLLLDEPTSGLDPLMEAVFTTAIREFRSAGGTVLLSSHILSEVESLCDRVSIIRDGRTVESGTLSALRHLSRTTLTATLDQPLAGPVERAALAALEGVADVALSGAQVTCTVDSGHLGATLAWLGAHGIRGLSSAPPTLEQLFLEQYRAGSAPPRPQVGTPERAP